MEQSGVPGVPGPREEEEEEEIQEGRKHVRSRTGVFLVFQATGK